MCRAGLVSAEQSVLSSGLPPEEALIMVAEKRKLLHSFLSIWS